MLLANPLGALLALLALSKREHLHFWGTGAKGNRTQRPELKSNAFSSFNLLVVPPVLGSSLSLYTLLRFAAQYSHTALSHELLR